MVSSLRTKQSTLRWCLEVVRCRPGRTSVARWADDQSAPGHDEDTVAAGGCRSCRAESGCHEAARYGEVSHRHVQYDLPANGLSRAASGMPSRADARISATSTPNSAAYAADSRTRAETGQTSTTTATTASTIRSAALS